MRDFRDHPRRQADVVVIERDRPVSHGVILTSEDRLDAGVLIQLVAVPMQGQDRCRLNTALALLPGKRLHQHLSAVLAVGLFEARFSKLRIFIAEVIAQRVAEPFEGFFPEPREGRIEIVVDRLLRADREPQNWLSYSGTVFNQRHSALTQITTGNVKNLEQKWVYQAQVMGNWQTTPLVVDGVMYFTQRQNDVIALDAKTGRVFWIYRYLPSPDQKVCCGSNNRGLAILGETLYMGTLDARLIALDAKSGRPLWNVEVADLKAAYSITHAPLIVKD